MEKQAAMEKIITIIRPFVKDQEALKSANEQTQILADLGVNSARLVDIILAFEDEFSIEIDDEAADKVRTLGDAAAMVAAKTSK